MTRLEPGAKAPAFTLRDHDEKKVSLKDFAGQRVVVYFYRCNRVSSSESTHAALLTELFGPTNVGLPFRVSSPAAE